MCIDGSIGGAAGCPAGGVGVDCCAGGVGAGVICMCSWSWADAGPPANTPDSKSVQTIVLRMSYSLYGQKLARLLFA